MGSDEPRGTAHPLICRGLLVHFKAVLKSSVLVAEAGISGCLISISTNFNNYMVPHPHAKHVDQRNSTHLNHNIQELKNSVFFYYIYLHRLMILIFPLSLKHGPRGQREIIFHQTIQWNRFRSIFLIIQDSLFLLITR